MVIRGHRGDSRGGLAPWSLRLPAVDIAVAIVAFGAAEVREIVVVGWGCWFCWRSACSRCASPACGVVLGVLKESSARPRGRWTVARRGQRQVFLDDLLGCRCPSGPRIKDAVDNVAQRALVGSTCYANGIWMISSACCRL